MRFVFVEPLSWVEKLFMREVENEVKDENELREDDVIISSKNIIHSGPGILVEFPDFNYDENHPVPYSNCSTEGITPFENEKIVPERCENKLICRFAKPISFICRENSYDYILSQRKEIFDIPFSVSILDECIPKAIELFCENKRGIVNLVNPGVVRASMLLCLNGVFGIPKTSRKGDENFAYIASWLDSLKPTLDHFPKIIKKYFDPNISYAENLICAYDFGYRDIPVNFDVHFYMEIYEIDDIYI